MDGRRDDRGVHGRSAGRRLAQAPCGAPCRRAGCSPHRARRHRRLECRTAGYAVTTSWRRGAARRACRHVRRPISRPARSELDTRSRDRRGRRGRRGRDTARTARPRRRASLDDGRRTPAHVHVQRHGGRPGVLARALASASSSPRSRTRSSATAWPRSIPMLAASAAPAEASWATTTSCWPSARGRVRPGVTASRSVRIPPRRRCTACSRRSSGATWGRSPSSSPVAARCGRSRSTSWPSWPRGRRGAWAWIRCGSRSSLPRSGRSRCSAARRARPSAELLDGCGIEFIGSTYASVGHGCVQLDPSGRRLDRVRVVSSPVLEGPDLPGVPADPSGFILADLHGRVPGLRRRLCGR